MHAVCIIHPEIDILQNQVAFEKMDGAIVTAFGGFRCF